MKTMKNLFLQKKYLKFKFTCSKILFTAGSILFLNCATAAENQIKNPGFETSKPKSYRQLAPDWTIRTADKTAKYHSIAYENPHGGKLCAYIHIPKGEKTGYIQQNAIPVENGCYYKLTFFARFSSLAESTKANISIETLDSKLKRLHSGTRKKLEMKPSGDWVKYKMEYLVPKDKFQKYYFRVRIKLRGAGKLWLDDFELLQTSVPQAITEFYPSSVNTDKILYPVIKEPSHLLIYPFMSTPKDSILIIDVPRAMPIAGVFPVYCSKYTELKSYTSTTSKGRIIYRIPVPAGAISEMSKLQNHLSKGIALLFSPRSGLKNGTLNWKLECSQKKVAGGTIKLQPLKAFKTVLPEKFTLYSWYMPFAPYRKASTNPDLLKQWLESMRNSGIRGGRVIYNDAKLFNSVDFNNIYSFWLKPPRHCLTGMLQGKKFKNFISTLLGRLKEYKTPTLNWNFEPGLDDYYHFCPECRKSFEKFSGKSTAGLSDGKSVEKRYPEKYLQFRNAQMRQILEKYSRWCKEAKCKAAICSYTISTQTTAIGLKNLQRRVGNLKSYASFLDCYMPQVYYTPEKLWYNLKRIKEFYPGNLVPVFTSAERHKQNDYPFSLLTADAIHLSTLMAAAQGCEKVMLFVGYFTLDGKQILALRKALKKIAALEDFFFSGKNVTQLVSVSSENQSTGFSLRSWNSKYLLSVFNPCQYNNYQFEFKLATDMQKFSIKDSLNKKLLVNSNGKTIFSANSLISIRLKPVSARFLTIIPPVMALKGYSQEKLDAAGEKKIREWTILNKDGWNCKASGKDKNPETIELSKGGNHIILKVSDGAVISSIKPGHPIIYKHKGNGGLFRDLFWLPQNSRWCSDTQLPYKFIKAGTEDGKLKVQLERALLHPRLKGLVLRKEYIFSSCGKAVDAQITIFNHGRKKIDFAYWSHNRPAVKRAETVYEISGNAPIRLANCSKENIYVVSNGTQWVKLSKKYFFGWTRADLKRFYFWNGTNYPTLEMIGEKVTLKPGKSWLAVLKYRILRAIPQAKPCKNFSILNPYSEKKKYQWRASIHNHSQFKPSYTHAPVPSPERLIEYRDHKVNPPYKIVAITEHNRITLPSNTIPRGKEPQWGVKGLLFIPGNERCIGSYRVGSHCGNLFGEINCVGVSREKIKVKVKRSYLHLNKTVKYRHNNWYRLRAEKTISDLINDGVFVALCHPNSKLNKNRVHKWNTTGYTYDELDLIFGNKDKGIKPFKRLPYALEIGNQGYDFTNRSNFTNAEAKWDYLLSRGHKLFGTASDDSHHQAPFAGWIVVNMNELTQKEFLKNLKSGNFYASQGPVITKIKLQAKTISIESAVPGLIEFIGKNGRILKSAKHTTKSSYTAKGNELYIRARVTHQCPEARFIKGRNIGRKRSAWTNPFFIVPTE